MEVEVLGLTDEVDTEFLVLYLESKRHSGGGPVQSHTRNGSLAAITFINTSDAENVLCKEEHIVKGVRIQVRRPPPWDSGKAAVCGLHPETDDTLLELYMENVSGRDEFSAVRSADRRTALISFQDPLSDEEFVDLTEHVRARKLHGASLTLQRVRVCAEILVENVTDGVSAELLEMYFESVRSGGGRVTSVTMLKHRSAAIVTFHDWEVVTHVLRRQHTLGERVLAVSPYYPNLLGSPDIEDSEPPEVEQSEGHLMDNIEEIPTHIPSMSASCDREEHDGRNLGEDVQVHHGARSDSLDGQQTAMPCAQYKEPATHNAGPPPMLNKELYMDARSTVETPNQAKDTPAISVQEVEFLMEEAELRFIQEYHHDLLAGMEEVLIMPLDMEGRSGFNVTGNPSSCKTAVELLRHIVSSLSSRTVTLQHPGVSLFLLEPDGQRALSDTECQYSCTIDASELSWRGRDREFVDPWSLLHGLHHSETSPAQISNTRAAAGPEDTPLAADMGHIEGIKSIASLLRSVERDGDTRNDSASHDGKETSTELNIPVDTAGEDTCITVSPEDDDHHISQLKDEELDKVCELSRKEYQERELDEEAQLLLALQMSMDSQEVSKKDEEEDLRRALELSAAQQVEDESELSLQRALEMSLCDTGAYEHSRTFMGEEVQPVPCNEMDPDAVRIKVVAADETSLVVACAALRKAVTTRLSTVTVEGVRDLPHKAEVLSALERKHMARITVREDQAHIQGFLQRPRDCRRELVEILSSVQEEAKPQVEPLCLDVQHKVEMVPVPESSEEYSSVVQAFLNTIPKQSYVTKVLQVQRVQNTLLYNQYLLKKRSMLAHDPKTPIERILYHGTTESGAREICHQGFNRSFCGKNAALYGQGVYFAVEAAISILDMYSPPTQEGKKFVLVSQVLTGDFTEGKKDMRTPPVMPSSNGDVPRRYDSLADNMEKPSIFVIFNDTQAYPQYLITCCKDRSPST